MDSLSTLTSCHANGARRNSCSAMAGISTACGIGEAHGSGIRIMHQAPSLAEAPPTVNTRTDDPRSAQYEMHLQVARLSSPCQFPVGDDHLRSPPEQERESGMNSEGKSTQSSTSTADPQDATETPSNGYNTEIPLSTILPPQAVFSINDSAVVGRSGRANRRRTGPLSAEQREKAALIRKLGACKDCRRRRVACNPEHHNMTWEAAHRMYRSQSQDMQDLTPISSDRSFHAVNVNYTHEPQHIEPNPSPTSQQSGQSMLDSGGRAMRTPLPSGPRLEKTGQAGMSLPSMDTFRSNLQSHASSIIANPNRGRYNAVCVLLLFWKDEDQDVRNAVDELQSVLSRYYQYTFEIDEIPIDPEPHRSRRWLSSKLDRFLGDYDSRDVLKVFYYNGHAYLDGNRSMILANSTKPEQACAIRWNGIQQSFEDAVADTLIIMDSPYFGLPDARRKCGTLEILAAGSFEEHANSPLARCAFTRAISEKLRVHATRSKPISTADLHAQLLSEYPRIVQELTPQQEFLTKYPAPLYLHLSDDNVPSTLLAPLQISPASGVQSMSSPASQLNLTIQLDKEPDIGRWKDWLRLMPGEVRDIRVGSCSAFQSNFQ